MDLTAFADEVGTTGPVTITGLGTRGGPVAGRSRGAAAGGHRVDPGRRDDDALRCRHAGRRRRRSAGRVTANAWHCRRAALSVARCQSVAATSADWATDRCVTCCCRRATCPTAARWCRRAARR